ncbi:hypothetical protein EWM64_g4422 [Hericium alpestre]|uniref:Calpain catalytic domain-containing protein n=1 Tax=Hericium alpestre TaxID=135208 RepID=A0A4Y9ZZK3_9AGAM|nr:hypothetical protein EWM64_g4422 [Hericium alpestre]
MSAKRAGSKQDDPEATYNKAAKAELSKNYDAAFRGYIDAATAYLALSRSAVDARSQTRLRSQASKALERAERIKAVKSGLTPVIRNPLSPDEQALVLKKGSTVNGLHVPLWSEADSGAFDSATRYHDPDGQLKLSAEQERVGTTWRRPDDVFQDVELLNPNLRGQDIVQRVIEDCSLCTSIAVCLEHSSRHRSKAALPVLHPCDASNRPERSKSGRYDLRVWFNGAHRRISIDEELPFHPDGSLMCLSTLDKSDLWPALVEKAYLKLMGGYDFPGSNSTSYRGGYQSKSKSGGI